VVKRFDGFIAQYLGDGVLIYFGYPQATLDTPRPMRTIPNEVFGQGSMS